MQLPAAVFEGKATMGQLAKNWAGSYLGNALGCALGCFLLLNCGLMVRGTIGAGGGRRSHIALGKKRKGGAVACCGLQVALAQLPRQLTSVALPNACTPLQPQFTNAINAISFAKVSYPCKEVGDD